MEQPMSTVRFLDLLNKPSRTDVEEKELQAELLRQVRANAKQGQQEQVQTGQPETTQAGSTEQVAPAQPETTAPVAPVTPAQPVQPEVGATAQDETYSLSTLRSEVNDAMGYLQTQKSTPATDQAIAAFMNAIYWINLAEQGK